MPFISCIVLSHDKPAFVGEAIGSLVTQTFADWEAVVFDSGVLHDRGFFDQVPFMNDRRIRLVRSWETEELRKTKTIASWCFNECFRKKLLQGEYVTYLCDDDFFYPGAFQAFRDFVQVHRGVMAMYGSIDITGLTAQGEKFTIGQFLAEEIKGSCCGSGPLDFHMDYLQLCHKAELFDCFPDEFWPESRDVMDHADGLFLEKVGARFPIHPVPFKIGQNRKVPGSLNYGGDWLELRLQICRMQEEINRLAGLLSQAQSECQACHEVQECLRYRVADRLNNLVQRAPLLHRAGKRMAQVVRDAWKRARRRAG